MKTKWITIFLSWLALTSVACAQQSIHFDDLKLGQELDFPLCKEISKNAQSTCIETIADARARDKIVGYGNRVGGVQGLKIFRLRDVGDFDQQLREQIKNTGHTITWNVSPRSIGGIMDQNNQVLQYNLYYCVSDFPQFVQTLDQQFGKHQFVDLTVEGEKLVITSSMHGYALYSKFYTWFLNDTVLVVVADSSSWKGSERDCVEFSPMTKDYFEQKSDDLKYEPKGINYM